MPSMQSLGLTRLGSRIEASCGHRRLTCRFLVAIGGIGALISGFTGLVVPRTPLTVLPCVHGAWR